MPKKWKPIPPVSFELLKKGHDGVIAEREQHSYALSDTDKRKIRHFGEQIKVIIDDSNAPIPKKESLLKKLNAFLTAVDKHRTGLETFSDFFIGMMHLGGDAIHELDKARPLIDSISRLLGRYQDMDDAQRQVPHEERKKIGPPKREEPPAKRNQSHDMDDDIPF